MQEVAEDSSRVPMVNAFLGRTTAMALSTVRMAVMKRTAVSNSLYRVIVIGADSMGGDGGDRPHGQKVVGAMPPSRPYKNFVMSLLYTAKRHIKNYECVTMKVKKVR